MAVEACVLIPSPRLLTNKFIDAHTFRHNDCHNDSNVIEIQSTRKPSEMFTTEKVFATMNRKEIIGDISMQLNRLNIRDENFKRNNRLNDTEYNNLLIIHEKNIILAIQKLYPKGFLGFLDQGYKCERRDHFIKNIYPGNGSISAREREIFMSVGVPLWKPPLDEIYQTLEKNL